MGNSQTKKKKRKVGSNGGTGNIGSASPPRVIAPVERLYNNNNGDVVNNNNAHRQQYTTSNGTTKYKSKKATTNSRFRSLFTKAPQFDNAGLAQTCGPPVGGEMPVCAESTLAKDSAYVMSDEQQLRNGGDRMPGNLDQRLLHKYEVIAIIGKGSFSRVLRVEHRQSRQPYAVKLVPAKNGTGPFENELAILNRLSHPFVIRLEEIFRSQTRVYIVMEMASGGELYDRIVAKGRYSEGEARSTMRMLLTGLQYLHGIGVTHRDLKPENLLYSTVHADARLLITDFGLAHQHKQRYLYPYTIQTIFYCSPGDEHSANMVDTCGTPEYIAPEVLLRLPYSNKIAYILMSGIMPFDDPCRSRLYRQIIRGNYVYYPEYWSATGDKAKGFVDCLLETDPEERLSADEAIAHPWFHPERVHLNVSIHLRGVTRPLAKPENFSENTSTTTAGNNNKHCPPERTRSSRSIRSVTRSDHGHRVDPREVDQLVRDPDIKKIANDHSRSRRRRRSVRSSDYGTMESSKDYGVF